MYKLSSFLSKIIISYLFVWAPNTHCFLVPYGIGQDFHISMEHGHCYKRESAIKEPVWQKATELYNKYVINNVDYQEDPRIPKIIHQIWLGGPLPERCKILQATWLKHHLIGTIFSGQRKKSKTLV